MGNLRPEQQASSSAPILRWFQFSLRSMFTTTAFVAIVVGIALESGSVRREMNSQIVTLRVDQARERFYTQLQMARERFSDRGDRSPVKILLMADNDVRSDSNSLRIAVGYDFSYDTKSNQASVRRSILSCLQPILWLSTYGFYPGWNWSVRHNVAFDASQPGRGKITIVAEYRRVGESGRKRGHRRKKGTPITAAESRG